MTSSAIRQSFLDFFKEKQHTIVPSNSLLPDSPDIAFTNAGMNQFVPIFLGQAPCPYDPARAADTQKCIRAGGKHNDLEDVGFDTYHHTFFEMLGNWSFGNYFKKEAIEWAWELVVGRWNFPASRLYATVYKPGPGDPASFDQEAYDYWAKIFTAAGLDPAIHIVNGNKKDNFWMMGDTGPCGPCSELHVNLLPGPRDPDLESQKKGRELVNSGDARCIEIWNLVFIQFNATVLRWEKKELQPGIFKEVPAETRYDALAAKHVDTGMGFERVTSMIQGTKGFTDFSEKVKVSNYETDVFRPIFDEIEKLTGHKYTSTLPASAQNLTEQEKIDVAFRVIADHVRTLSFSVADGIRPSNEGRGYVLRRILRRAVKYGRNLGLKEPFLGKLVPVLGTTMGHIFPEVVAKADLIKKVLTNEEEGFFRNLDRGVELFELFAQQRPVTIGNKKYYPQQRPTSPGSDEREIFITGEIAFLLSDTYGFPLDLTELMARERGWPVDIAEFERLLAEQKAKSQAAQVKEVITVEGSDTGESSIPKTSFFGYEAANLKLHAIVEGQATANDQPSVAFNRTPFYAAMGGQLSDTGVLEHEDQIYKVKDVTNQGGVYYHWLDKPFAGSVKSEVILYVDEPRRHKIEAHHSGTHLLNWALRKVLGNTIGQKGSYVGPDRLRFDFNHGTALTPEELAEVERLVNEKINADVPVTWEERPYAEVKGDPSILQAFGDKYGDIVRVVSIGDFSKELCGGTHVRQSGAIGFFKILSESAIAAGIRRIEATSGAGLIEHVREHLPKQEEQHTTLRQRKPDLAPLETFSGEESAAAFWKHWESRVAALHAAAASVAQHEKEEAKAREALFQKRAATDAESLIASARTLNEIPYISCDVEGAPAAYLPVLADALKSRWQGVAVLAAVDQGKVALLCSVSPAFTKKIQAGKVIQTIAPLVGGKGGGRPELAQGGGTNPEGVPAALQKAQELVG
jgi:alanyl-tRNA synthetase